MRLCRGQEIRSGCQNGARSYSRMRKRHTEYRIQNTGAEARGQNSELGRRKTLYNGLCRIANVIPLHHSSFDYKGCAVLAVQLFGNVVAAAMYPDGFSRGAPAGFPNSFGFCQFNKKAPTIASPSHPRRSIWRLEDLPRPYF